MIYNYPLTYLVFYKYLPYDMSSNFIHLMLRQINCTYLEFVMDHFILTCYYEYYHKSL